MMRMPWRLLLRYYGYVYQDHLREQDEMDRLDHEAKLKEREQNREPNWKPL